MLFGRAPVHSFGRTTNNRVLAESFPRNVVWINANAAKSIPGFSGGVKSGDMVVLVNQDGVRSEPIQAKVTQRIREDSVYLVHGFGHTAKGLHYAFRNGAAVSELVTRYKVDPLMGGTGMNVNFVKIEKAG
jgi:thiosulfate reductase/polysulfide reductase chain A